MEMGSFQAIKTSIIDLDFLFCLFLARVAMARIGGKQV